MLTEKWIDVVPIFQILCIGRLLSIVANSTEQALIANGDSNLFFRQQLFKLLLKIFLVALALPFGIIAIAIADAIQTLFQFIITNCIAKKKLEFTMETQYQLVFPYIFSGIVASSVGGLVYLLFENYIILLLFPLLISSIIYIFMITVVFKKSIIATLKKLLNSNK